MSVVSVSLPLGVIQSHVPGFSRVWLPGAAAAIASAKSAATEPSEGLQQSHRFLSQNS